MLFFTRFVLKIIGTYNTNNNASAINKQEIKEAIR